MIFARIGLVLIVCLAWAAPAQAQIKSVTLDIDPKSPPLAAGATGTVTAKYINRSQNQQLG